MVVAIVRNRFRNGDSLAILQANVLAAQPKYSTVLLVAGYGTLLTAISQWSGGDPIRFAIFLTLAALAGFLQVRLRGLATRLSVRFFVVLIGLSMLSWAEMAVIACVSAIVETLWWTRPRPHAGNTGLYGATAVLATSAAYATYHVPHAASSPLLMVLAAIVYFAVSSVTQTLSASALEKPWKQSLFWTFPHYVAGGSAAGLLTIADRHNGWEITLLVVPMLYWMVHAYKLYLEGIEQGRRGIEELNALHFRTLESLAGAIEGRDPEHCTYKRSVWSNAREIGRKMGLSDAELQALRTAVLLRNVGKLAVPEHILSKPGRLTKAEFDKMQIHPAAGAAIAEQAHFPYPVTPMVRSHREKWDGTGYPEGLRGEEIPVGARILSAVDSLEALVSTRSYRRAYTIQEGIQHMQAESGKSFDPKVIEILVSHYRELEVSTEDTGDGPALVSPIAAARQEAQLLYALAQDLGNSLSLEETFSVLALHVKPLCPHDTLAVYIRREDYLEAEYATGVECQQVGSAIVPWGEGICGRAAASATPSLNEDPLGDSDRISVGGATSLRSSLAIPLEGFGGVVGILCLFSKATNAFTNEHLRILSAVTTKVAVSVENALKYRQAERSAVTDMLTELPNARSLFLHLDSELSRAKRGDQNVAVLVCDLDGFKQINDRFGHLEGNRVLRAVASALRFHCREYDTVARLGGDEFVIILPGKLSESVSTKVQQLASAVAQAGYETVGEGCLGISVGAAYYPADGEDAEALLAVADQRMYREKQRGAGTRRSGASGVLV